MHLGEIEITDTKQRGDWDNFPKNKQNFGTCGSVSKSFNIQEDAGNVEKSLLTTTLVETGYWLAPPE